LLFTAVNHEIRNPLQVIIGCIEILKSSDPKNVDVIEIANVCSLSLLNLIENLVDLGKIEANDMKFNKVPTNVIHNLNKILNIAKLSTKPKGLFIKSNITRIIPDYLLYDHSTLSRILINLITNAIHYTEKGGIYIECTWHSFLEQQNNGNSQDDLDALLKKLLNSSTRLEKMETPCDGI
jgi:signal transduction histidine kinase